MEAIAGSARVQQGAIELDAGKNPQEMTVPEVAAVELPAYTLPAHSKTFRLSSDSSERCSSDTESNYAARES
jgi:hypothetical protein